MARTDMAERSDMAEDDRQDDSRGTARADGGQTGADGQGMVDATPGARRIAGSIVENGVIIDHIPAGGALRLLDYLGIDPTEEEVTLVMNTQSGRFGTKDILILRNVFSVRGEIVAFVAPKAVINVVKEGRIVSKDEPVPAKRLDGVGRCWNSGCVTNCERDVAPSFYLTDPKKVTYRCLYCDSEARI